MDLTETEGIFFLNTGLKTEAYSLRIESGRMSSNMATEPERSTDFRPCSSYFLRRYSPVKKAEGSVGIFLAA